MKIGCLKSVLLTTALVLGSLHLPSASAQPGGTPPVITAQPADLNLIPGATATFEVVASGNPLTYRWLFNGKALAAATNALLTLFNVHSRDAGLYSVEVRNASGATLSRQATLALSFPT